MLNNMKNGTAPPPPTTTATYTTIPISGSDVISRSIYNISSFLSLRRPWTEVLASGVFDRPESLSAAAQRLRKNLAYFRLNYGIFLCACALLSLIGTPLYLILISAVFALWLIFYFFREDPLYLWGHSIRDRFVLAALICVTLVTFWFARVVESVVVGLGLGLVVLAFHGVFRNPEGLFMDEAEAASSGLIGRTV
ncbi:hypothetical protein Scep_013629 [Stephania cephalantha]|uniref:PRA1 family protein n=1 Tax=Stephania cephalantha TaxID=152367 RepID=A0AAP0JIL2_9MAGN